MNCDEDIFGVQKASLNMFWEYSPYSTNLASDWLRADSSTVEEEGRKKMDTGNLFVELREVQHCQWDPE